MALKQDADTFGLPALEKAPTGIQGFDEITGGGLPRGRPSLVCGGPGCGKTLFSMEFLVRGAMQYGEPGVFVSFEETDEELAQNVASLGFDLNELQEEGKLSLDYVQVERSEIEEAGEYDLEGLFIRLGFAIDSIGAKRVVLDTLEALFGGLSNEAILRAELRRLFRWLKTKGVTAIITAERGEGGTFTRQGLEEYVSDCVILLDHRVTEQISTRRLRIVKYRGSMHGTNEYPFLIGESGIAVLPVTSLGMDHPAPSGFVSTGVAELDVMLNGNGYYQGSSVLVSGTAGSGKTSLAAHFADAICRSGRPCLYFAFEESPRQIIRNMRSIGIELEHWERKGLLHFHAARPTSTGLEMHLVVIHKLIMDFKPSAIIVDPITSFLAAGSTLEVKSLLVRLIDYLKSSQITAFFTSLTSGGDAPDQSEVGVSSLIDTWILLRNIESNGERNRGLYVLKSRGMAHSNQIREFLLTEKGIQLENIYLGPNGVLTGSAKAAQQAMDQAAQATIQHATERKRLNIERKRKTVEAQIAAMRAELEAEEDEMAAILLQEEQQQTRSAESRRSVARMRNVGSNSKQPANGPEKEAQSGVER
jgi:circadian clock protein KaiC